VGAVIVVLTFEGWTLAKVTEALDLAKENRNEMLIALFTAITKECSKEPVEAARLLSLV